MRRTTSSRLRARCAVCCKAGAPKIRWVSSFCNVAAFSDRLKCHKESGYRGGKFMKIAHLIIAHEDPEHINRLSSRLSLISDVYIHIDKKKNLESFRALNTKENVYFIPERESIRWGGWNSVVAEINLLKTAMQKEKYDRVVLLQGADYPIKSNKEIVNFFENHADTEFVRGCNCTTSRDFYFRMRCRSFWLHNNFGETSLIRKVWNRLTQGLHIELRSGYATGDGVRHEVFWGAAQWALTGACAKFVVDFYENHPKYNHWYYHSFPADELYFTTVIMNSDFAKKTTFSGPEKEIRGLENWRNLHYFEYLPGKIRTFTIDDYAEIMKRKDLYVRKVNTRDSKGLLDMLDRESKAKELV